MSIATISATASELSPLSTMLRYTVPCTASGDWQVVTVCGRQVLWECCLTCSMMTSLSPKSRSYSGVTTAVKVSRRAAALPSSPSTSSTSGLKRIRPASSTDVETQTTCGVTRTTHVVCVSWLMIAIDRLMYIVVDRHARLVFVMVMMLSRNDLAWK